MLPYMKPFFKEIHIRQLSEQRLHVMKNMLKACALCLRVRSAIPSESQWPGEVRNVLNEITRVELCADDELVSRAEKLLDKHKIVYYQPSNELVVKAIGLGSGPWHICSVGHPYVDDRCIGATETIQCPKCSDTIPK